MSVMTYQITSVWSIYSTVCSGADKRKHQSSTSLAFLRVNCPAQRTSYAENVFIWWRNHGIIVSAAIAIVLGNTRCGAWNKRDEELEAHDAASVWTLRVRSPHWVRKCSALLQVMRVYPRPSAIKQKYVRMYVGISYFSCGPVFTKWASV